MSAALLLLTAALAHKPSFSEGQYSSPDTPYWVADPEVSIVVYHEVTCDAPQLWMQLYLDPAVPLYLQLGVPVIDRLADYRPSVALLGPGLPEISLPFEVPEGMGGILIETDDVTEPSAFYEPFSQTDSWILYEETLDLPEAGLGYIVAWNPEEITGKLWVAVGTREEFTSDDFEQLEGWLDQTAQFHESGDYETDDEISEIDCAAPAEEDPESGKAAEGCATAPARGGFIALLAVAALVGRRRLPTHPCV